VTEPIRPDDLARSRSGRIPQWVLDEAKGIKTEPVPFRATSVAAPPGGSGRGMRWVRVLLTVGIVGGIVALGLTDNLGIGSKPSALSQSRQAPPLGHEEAKHPLGTPQPVALASTAYRFSVLQDDDKTPVTWSPCRPIHYVVRPDHAPLTGARMIADAFSRLATVTGFTFVNDGTTTEAPRTDRDPYQKSRYGDRWAPVLVTWSTADEVPDFGVDIAGEAGAQRVRSTSGDWVYVTGAVALDATKLGSYVKKYGEPEARAVILHELGHLMGLAHVNDASEVMYPRGRLGITEYQPGDLAGLNLLASGPCQKDI